MKNIIRQIIILSIAVCLSQPVFAQIIPGFNYQAVVRNNDGTIASNKDVKVRTSIFNDDGKVFSKIYNLKTNNFGLFNVIIGENSTDFANIDWTNGKHSLKVEINISNGFEDMGTMLLYPVPFANLAENVINKDDEDADPENEIQILSFDNTSKKLSISNGNSVIIPFVNVNPVFERHGTTIRQIIGYDTDDFILGRDLLPQNGENITDTMFFFDKSKVALRFGKLYNSTYWSPDSIGVGSFAHGLNTKAKGENSSAWGWETEASGSYATTWGSGSEASGDYATAWGDYSEASGDYATAWGNFSKASKFYATAWGDYSEASGAYTTAWGDYSDASGVCATAWGSNSKASGDYATAWGYVSEASGVYATAWGEYIKAPSYVETALGRYNTDYTANSSNSWNSNDRLFSIGNGTSGFNRHNALTVLKNGNMGINRNVPDEELDVEDGKDNDNNVKLCLRSSGYNNDAIIEFYEFTSSPVMSIHYDGGDNKLYFKDLTVAPAAIRVSINRDNGSINPGSHKVADLGADGKAWDDIYYDDLHNQGASAFVNRSPAREILSYPPLGKKAGDFDYKTDNGDIELDPKSMPPGLSDDNSLLTDEISSYNYKTNYEQQVIIKNMLNKIEEQESKINKQDKEIKSLKNRLEAIEKMLKKK